MLKLSSEAADYFNELVDGKDVADIKRDIKKDIKNNQPIFHYSDQGMEDLIEYCSEELEKATTLYNKMKPVKPEKFAINEWGYEQTNLSNLTVVGTVRGSVIILANYKVFSIRKSKYTKKEAYTYLDDVISTSWQPAHTSKELQENTLYNASYGY